jgi:hypothetical protein
MMARCTIFKDSTTEMPSEGETEIATPVKVRQMTSNKGGALAPMISASDGLDVVHAQRPRRGHDY